jgi:hypothetical protein
MLWGLQSSVTNRESNGTVARLPESGAMSPRAQKPGVQALGWQVSPESGSTWGGTGVGEGQLSALVDEIALDAPPT